MVKDEMCKVEGNGRTKERILCFSTYYRGFSNYSGDKSGQADISPVPILFSGFYVEFYQKRKNLTF